MRSIIVALLLLSVGPGRAAVIDVFPGPGTPFQDAIDAASEGDTLRIHGGSVTAVYPEALVIDKPLKIKKASTGLDVIVDAGCAAPAVLDIASDRVRVRGRGGGGFVDPLFRFRRGQSYGVRVQNAFKVSLRNLDVTAGGDCGGPGTAVAVVQGRGVTLRSLHAFGNGPGSVALHIADIALGETVRVRKGRYGAETGVLITDSTQGATLGRGGISLGSISLELSPPSGTHVVLQNADGIVMSESHVVAFTGQPTLSLSLDALSDFNAFFDNVNCVSVLNQGSGNCGENSCDALLPPCP